jgi:hypothetical protein
MTVGKRLLSHDSVSFVFGVNSVELRGAHSGEVVRAQLLNNGDLPNFTFQSGRDWRSSYSAFSPSEFSLELFTCRNGVWVSYLQTLHNRAS